MEVWKRVVVPAAVLKRRVGDQRHGDGTALVRFAHVDPRPLSGAAEPARGRRGQRGARLGRAHVPAALRPRARAPPVYRLPGVLQAARDHKRRSETTMCLTKYQYVPTMAPHTVSTYS
eukprot:6203731-Pleurochrysis_carterae.AAC.2